jgi:hypothetical protein
MDVGDVYMEWKNRFEFIAKKVVGMKSRCVRKGVKKLPKFVKRLYEIRNTLRKEAEAEGDKKLFQLADDVSQKIKKICIEGNKKRWDSFCAEVCMEKLGARDFFSALHRVMGSKSTEVCGIRNLEGEIVNNGSEVRETWKEFFENLGRDGVNEGQFDEEFRVLMDAKVRQMEVDGGDVYQVELDYPISVSEVSEQLKLLKNWKAGGPDGLRNELLKICDSVDGVEMLVVLLNKIWGDEAMPDELAVGRIVTLFKGGDVHDCGDYRGISLLNVVYKLLSAILNKRLVRYCDENGVLDEEQGGFRQGRGCTDQIYSLHTVVAERKGRGVDSYMCFIDVKKA